jgi:hypothetical protein
MVGQFLLNRLVFWADLGLVACCCGLLVVVGSGEVSARGYNRSGGRGWSEW